jgi:uncharacterized tellurite resistance protein B-like protein
MVQGAAAIAAADGQVDDAEVEASFAPLLANQQLLAWIGDANDMRVLFQGTVAQMLDIAKQPSATIRRDLVKALLGIVAHISDAADQQTLKVFLAKVANADGVIAPQEKEVAGWVNELINQANEVGSLFS